MAHKKVALHKTYEDVRESPNLLNAVADQIEKIKQAIHSLNEREAICLVAGHDRAIRFRTIEVQEQWLPEDKFDIIERAKKQIYGLHAYFGLPQMTADQQDRRMDRYVSQVEETPKSDTAEGQKETAKHGFL